MNYMAQRNPLVSVIIITYNSSKFVLDTLESVRLQTYGNIELIVSDDCSSDSTRAICKEWIKKYSGRFIRSELVIAQKNRGIPGNCNQGFNQSNGDWIKFVAGDDVLLKDSIEKFVGFLPHNPKARIIESRSQFFKNTLKIENYFGKQPKIDGVFYAKDTTAFDQYQMLLRRNYLHAPSVFLSRSVVKKVGGFDERFRWVEDHPLWLRITRSGNKVFFLNEITVFYRVHSSSVFGSVGDGRLFNDFYEKRVSFDQECIFPHISRIEVFCRRWEYYRKKCIEIIGMNRNNVFGKLLSGITSILSPRRALAIYLKIRGEQYVGQRRD